MSKSKKPIPQIVPHPDDQDARWKAFVALTYRTTRAILRARKLVGEGQTLADAAAETRYLLRQTAMVDANDPIVGHLVGSDLNLVCSTAPFPDLEHTKHATAALQTFVALELGEPDDSDLLFFLETSRILEHFPSMETFIDFERQLVEYAGARLANGNRPGCQKAITAVFGKLCHAESAVIMRLPFAYLKQYTVSTPAEDRALMVARLERAARRAAASMDTRTEVAVLRSIAQIQGLTYQDVDNEQRNLREIFRGPPKSAELPRIPDISRVRAIAEETAERMGSEDE